MMVMKIVAIFQAKNWYILLLQVFFLSAMFSAGDVVLLVAQTKRVKKLEEKVGQ